jgi:serine protease Do
MKSEIILKICWKKVQRKEDTMRKYILIGCLAIIICLSLLAGCSVYSATGPSSAQPAQTTAKASQQAAITSPPAAPASAQNNPSAVTAGTSSAQNIAVNLPSFADLLDVAEHSVVAIDISATTTTSRGRTVQQQGAGSGWIMDASGTIVTNNHVVDGANSITVTTIDGQKFTAQVLNTDPTTDLALIKVTTTTPLQSLKIGDASNLRRGDWVLAIGNPLGEGIIATQGIVSRLGVNVALSSTQTYNDLIETTAAINPGNSGGPLINLAGEVVGITSLGASGSGVQGIGYAISMADAFPVIQKLASK